MPKIWKMNNSGESTAGRYCIKDDASAANCPYKETMRKTFAMTPYPEIFLININWFSDHTSYMETFHFSVSNQNAASGTHVVVDNLDILYDWETSLGGSNNFDRELNQGIALGTGAQVDVPLAVSAHSGG